MDRKQFFALIMDICDWEQQGDDDAVLHPLIQYLSQQSDEDIFLFDEIMAELLYELDTEKNFRKACKYYNHSEDSFLYSRCCALINGEEYYEKVKAGKIDDLWEMEFESVLYVPMWAWGIKHKENCTNYPHVTAKSYETGSNTLEWKHG